MREVFVSYAHQDKDRVTDLVASLERSSVRVWWDADLPHGKSWDDQIERALENASTIVVVWSRQAVASENVKDEAHYALEERKALPVRIEDVQLPYRWRRLQYVDLMARPVERNEKWAEVVAALRDHGADAVPPDGSPSRPTTPPNVESQRKIALSPNAVIPAVLVLLSLLFNVLGSLVAAPGAYWPIVSSAAFGVSALVYAFWNVVPHQARNYS